MYHQEIPEQTSTSVARWLIECQDANVSATSQRPDISRHRVAIIRAAKDIVAWRSQSPLIRRFVLQSDQRPAATRAKQVLAAFIKTP
ncbi:hypothetical protein EAO21_28790 [Klebsiella pneumoniae]|nr:hypothetical protein EAO21_28790 [Klebsiella pneumoniae]